MFIMTRLEKIKKIIEYTKLYDSDKLWYGNPLTIRYYENYTIQNINYILLEYEFKLLES